MLPKNLMKAGCLLAVMLWACGPIGSDFVLEEDVDGDGHTFAAGDCDDRNASVYPGAPELTDGLDNDCNGLVDDDVDRDGWLAPDDCDDNDPTRHPIATEICDDALDNNCNGLADADDAACQEPPECFEMIDIVFVLDVSTTMGYVLSTLQSEIASVWLAAEALSVDDPPNFGLVVFVDDFTVVSNTTYTSVTDLQTDFNFWYSHTSSNQQTQSTASNLDWPENSLDALAAAAQDFQWRDPELTLRVVIHATDDTFVEHPASFSSGLPANQTYADVVSQLQDQKIRVAAFAAHLGGSSGNQNVEAGFFADYNGQPSIPVATSGNVFDIDQVYQGSISLAEAINQFVLEERCTPYIPR